MRRKVFKGVTLGLLVSAMNTATVSAFRDLQHYIQNYFQCKPMFHTSNSFHEQMQSFHSSTSSKQEHCETGRDLDMFLAILIEGMASFLSVATLARTV